MVTQVCARLCPTFVLRRAEKIKKQLLAVRSLLCSLLFPRPITQVLDPAIVPALLAFVTSLVSWVVLGSQPSTLKPVGTSIYALVVGAGELSEMDRRRTGFGQGCKFRNWLKDKDLRPLMDRTDIKRPIGSSLAGHSDEPKTYPTT